MGGLSRRRVANEWPLPGSLNGTANGSNWGAEPTRRFARPEWRASAKADAHINGVERLIMVGSCRSSLLFWRPSADVGSPILAGAVSAVRSSHDGAASWCHNRSVLIPTDCLKVVSPVPLEARAATCRTLTDRVSAMPARLLPWCIGCSLRDHG